ncbi:MAG: hypothetical protein FRX49_09865 [Trebouxia sp. A1-2]|nr:MAG: hypothetical protein FRX49_09865 [Trebouxia sp. A1-2]
MVGGHLTEVALQQQQLTSATRVIADPSEHWHATQAAKDGQALTSLTLTACSKGSELRQASRVVLAEVQRGVDFKQPGCISYLATVIEHENLSMLER